MRVENISRFKKERFLKLLPEDDFRDRVVRPLFLRTGYTDGRDMCGPNEHGKDAIFIEQDRLGFTQVLAIQTKKGNMNLGGTAHSNIVEAITQLKTASSTHIILLKNRQKVVPNKVILCASGKINDAAKNHILTEVNNPNIQFLDIEDLIPIVDEKMPELWLGIDAEILPYFQAIKRQVIGDGEIEIRTGIKQDGVLQGAASDDVFVSLNLYRTTIKLKKYRGKMIEVPKFEEFPIASIVGKKSRRVLIIGDAGAGKSTGLLRIAYVIASKGFEEEKKYKIPILLKSIDILRNRPTDLLEYCDQATKALAGTTKSAFTLADLSDGRVILLIDAIDELPTDDDRRYVLDMIEDFSSIYPETQILLTSRPYRFISELSQLRRYEEFRICPISWKQAEKIVTTVTKHKEIPKAQSQEFLRRLEKIHGIELNPLLVYVFAATSDYTKQDIPANVTELFKKFTELMLGRWDENKGLKHQYQYPLKDFILTRIAFKMHGQKKTSILREDAEEIVKKELQTRGHEADTQLILSEMFDRSGLFRISGSEIEFRHHLLQEFFAGRGIESPEFVKAAVTDEWWKRALVFYLGANPDKIDLLKSVAEAVSGIDAEKLLQASTTIGLALQACYLSPVAEKIEIWKWVVKALGIAQKKCLELFDPEAKYPQTSMVHYYLYSRDSVALSHLKTNIPNLNTWTKEIAIGEEELLDIKLFWLIVGLIECGDIEEAEKAIKDFHPEDPRLLMAIHLGCHLAHEIRPLSRKEKKHAKSICTHLDSKIAPYKEQLIKEIGSTLLEMRNGKIKAIDDEVDPTNKED